MTSTDRINLSPRQSLRLEALEARFPATTFDVVDQDRLSCALTVECEDLEVFRVLTITAAGRCLEA